MKKAELLAPAGSREKLLAAIHYGADAVYLAGEKYGLRAGAANFHRQEFPEIFRTIHQAGKKGYITLNIIAHNADFDGLGEYIDDLVRAEVDAVIVADYGIFSFIKKHFPDLPVHISTQANVTNGDAARFWQDLGASRITLARELSLGEIEQIRKRVDVELEVFAHGAMCMAYSGRCMLSNYLVGRDANKGECVHVCRWGFTLIPTHAPEISIEVEEDERGTYLLNSNDLWTIPILDRILDTGVNSIKIEGRMKSVHYVSLVTKTYREALDSYYQMGFIPEEVKYRLMNDLEKTSHRQFFTGFYEKKPGPDSHNMKTSAVRSDYELVGIVKEIVHKEGVVIEARARFRADEELILVTADGENTLRLPFLKNVLGEPIVEAKPNQTVVVPYDKLLKIHGLLARNKKDKKE